MECTFVEPSDVADFKFRIYLASCEIPLSGNPTLPVVASLVHRGLVSGDRLTIETQAGLIKIALGPNGLIAVDQIAPTFGPKMDNARVAVAVGLSTEDILFQPQVVSIELPFTITVLRDQDALAWAALDYGALADLQASINFPDTDVIEPFLVTLDGATAEGDTYSRLLLAPPMPPEDLFTGSATDAMASYLWAHGLIETPDIIF